MPDNEQPKHLLSALESVTKLLLDKDIQGMIIGGLAASLVGSPRFTNDIDLLAMLTMIALSGTTIYPEVHHVEDCSVCHYSGQTESAECVDCSNLMHVRCEITTPNSGIKQVTFLGNTGANSYADGDSTYNGVCEVCHTQTLVHTNTGNGVNHFAGQDCIACHPHA